MRRRLGEWGKVCCVHLLDLESALPDERRYVAGHVAALESPLKKWLCPLLPPPYWRIGRKPVLKEDELAAWLQNSSDTSNGLHHSGYRAKRKSTNDRIDAAVPQGNSFTRQIQKFYIQFRSTTLLLRHSDHSWIGFEGIDLGHFGGIVVNEVHAWAKRQSQALYLEPKAQRAGELSRWAWDCPTRSPDGDRRDLCRMA